MTWFKRLMNSAELDTADRYGFKPREFKVDRGAQMDRISRIKTTMMINMDEGNAEMLADELVTIGRVSVLQDFDAMCAADGFIGFSDAEWKAVKKFFAFNKASSKWDI